MHQTDHNLPAPAPGATRLIARHLFLLLVALVILAVLYVEARNLTSFGWAVVLLLLAHVVAVIVIMYGGRSFLSNFVRKIHGTQAAQPQSHSHSHGDGAHTHSHETEGVTISWARFYDIFTRVIFAGNVRKMMQAAIRLAAIQPGEMVLDVGCGTGTLAIMAKEGPGRDAQIAGIDAAPEMIERARQKAAARHLSIDFQQGLAERVQFEDATFDVVMNSLMMHHLPGQLQGKAIAEMYRVLKPGGRLLIVDFEPPQKGLFKSLLTMILGEMTSIDNTKLLPIVNDAGFQRVEMGEASSLATYVSAVKPAG
jgi:demethylmenaquinone methyltransferase/2-methoxy-6-polyprenyl-1,4-benzoquinol methylase/phosphoethanolamine N-methyltransferase